MLRSSSSTHLPATTITSNWQPLLVTLCSPFRWQFWRRSSACRPQILGVTGVHTLRDCLLPLLHRWKTLHRFPYARSFDFSLEHPSVLQAFWIFWSFLRSLCHLMCVASWAPTPDGCRRLAKSRSMVLCSSWCFSFSPIQVILALILL